MSQSSETPSSGTPAGEAPPTPPSGRRKKLLRVGGTIGAVLVVVGLAYYLYARQFESTDDAFLEADVVAISPHVAGFVQKVYVNDNQQVKAGDLLVEIDPRDFQARLDQAKAQLQATIAHHQGSTANVNLTRTTSGAGVEQAQSGVSLAKAGVQTAQAKYSAAQSKERQAQAMIKSAEAFADQARAEVNVSEAETVRTRADLDRLEPLVKSQSASPLELTNARAAARSAQATLDATKKRVIAAEAEVIRSQAAYESAVQDVKQAQSEVTEAEAKVGQAQAALASAQGAPQQIEISQAQAQGSSADVEQAKAAVEQAQLQLSYTKIIAPDSGRVTKKSVEPGAYVQVGQSLMAIVPADAWVVANYKETQLTLMKPGQPATIEIDAYPGVSFQGHVDSIQAGAGARFSLFPPENATGNYVKVVQRVPVKIVFNQMPDPKYELGPGMSVVPTVKVR